MKAKIGILSPDNTEYVFSFIIHESEKVEDQQIESEFYKKFSLEHKTPEGKHYEIEITSPSFREHPLIRVLHIHPSEKNQKDFICWTKEVPDVAEVMKVIRLWSAGTVYSLTVRNTWFAGLFGEHGLESNHAGELRFIEVLEEEYRIRQSFSYYNFSSQD
jgi:hypothetical protein